jgi:hypothetical protein
VGRICWRDFNAIIARGGRTAKVEEALRVGARQMLHRWHRVRDATLMHVSFRTYMQPIRWEVERLLETGQRRP